MANNGKKLETIVYLIQQTLKDAQGTQVYQNHKLLNDSGEKREFDVIIESVINDFKLTIAIECKDYSKPVSVEKIEAFNSKCARVKTINKKVFISSKGFQSGALSAACAFGIDLYTVEDVASELILSWLPVKSLGLRFEVKKPQLIADEDVYGTGQRFLKERDLIYFEHGESPRNIITLLNDVVYLHKSLLWSANLKHFFNRRISPKLPECLELNMDLPLDKAYAWDINGEKIEILGIHADLIMWIIEKDPEVERAVAYQPVNGKAQAHGLKIKLSAEESADLIFTGKGANIFYNDKAGQTHQLVELGKYDPKTGKFEETVSLSNSGESGL